MSGVRARRAHALGWADRPVGAARPEVVRLDHHDQQPAGDHRWPAPGVSHRSVAAIRDRGPGHCVDQPVAQLRRLGSVDGLAALTLATAVAARGRRVGPAPNLRSCCPLRPIPRLNLALSPGPALTRHPRRRDA